ncbi:hypothetical protein KBD81_00715 [Candidatus Woesebacteria bacterium]|nr:hypothetical protein [Candidatus Woesebacteria bacterium]
MHSIGKFIVMIAVVIVILAVFLNYSGLSRNASLWGGSGYNSRVSPSESRTSSTAGNAPDGNSIDSQSNVPDAQNPLSGGLGDLFAPNSSGVKFDLDGPLVCDYKDAETTVTVRVLSKNILVKYAQLQTESGKAFNVLVKDGVLYMWDQGSYEGKKVSGIGQYLSLFDSFSAFTTPDMILSMIPQADGKKLSPQQVSGLKDSCSPEKVDETIFVIPKAVQFVETDLKKVQVPDDTIID